MVPLCPWVPQRSIRNDDRITALERGAATLYVAGFNSVLRLSKLEQQRPKTSCERAKKGEKTRRRRKEMSAEQM